MTEENKKGNIVSINGIKTRVRTKEEIDKLWNIFKEKYADEYEKFMGYGVKEIEKIGYEKFINFWDVSSEEEMDFKKDVIRIIPCRHCNKEFATYQLDYGLCDSYKLPVVPKTSYIELSEDIFQAIVKLKKFNYEKIYSKANTEEDLKKFEEMLKISDNENPGSSYDLIASFVYLGLDEFFYKNTPFKKKVEQSVTFDDLNGVLSKDFILSFVGDKAKERKFLKIAKTLKMKISTVNRIVSLERIFSSKDTIDRKKERIENMYKEV